LKLASLGSHRRGACKNIPGVHAKEMEKHHEKTIPDWSQSPPLIAYDQEETSTSSSGTVPSSVTSDLFYGPQHASQTKTRWRHGWLVFQSDAHIAFVLILNIQKILKRYNYCSQCLRDKKLCYGTFPARFWCDADHPRPATWHRTPICLTQQEIPVYPPSLSPCIMFATGSLCRSEVLHTGVTSPWS
jgi:hypothetical protein